MAFELERAYVFGTVDISSVVEYLGCTVVGDSTLINDDYINKHLRIRTTADQIILTRKSGNKKDGIRVEKEYPLDPEAANAIAPETRLRIVKRRYVVFHACKDFKITIDVITSPMQISVLEIESTNGEMPSTAHQIFGKDLVECPLSAWDLFQQKIGICGAPSSGKTEMGKTLSNILNTRLSANAFHVTEYATTFIQKYGVNPGTMDQFLIWHCQKAREQDASSKAGIVVSDCPTFLTYIYMLANSPDKMDKQFRVHLVKLYKRVIEDLDSYSKIVYLRPQPLVENNIRFHTNDQIRDLANRIHCFLKWHNVPHMVADREDADKILQNLFFLNVIPEERWSL